MAVLTETFDGVPGGMNLALPQQELDDTEARYLQDVLLDYPGLTRRRGPIRPMAGAPSFSYKASGLVQTLDPSGNIRIGALTGDATHGQLEVLAPDYLSVAVALPWATNLTTAPPSSPYHVVDSKPNLTGGALIGTSSRYDSASPAQGLALWRGGNKATYSTGTITVARGSAAVTGSGTTWVGNIVPGMFLFGATDEGYSTYIGVVQAVVDNTHLTLGLGSPYNVTAKTYDARSLRGICPRIVKGRITTATTATTVTGGQTKFIDQGMNSGVWQIYRASDYAFVGKVASVTSNIAATLTANAAIAMANDRFVALKADGDYNLQTMSDPRKPGFLNAIYAERQWYANNGQSLDKTARVWFSDASDPEGLDLSEFDGDFINVGSSRGSNQPIQALQAAYNALVILKEDESYAVFGTTPSTFQVRKLTDDGTLSGMSVQPWNGGVIWAGREGIHFFDGIEPENIAQKKLGDFWKELVRSFDPSKYRMWSMMVRDHYFLFIENLVSPVPIVKGTVATTPTRMTFVINMSTRAVVAFTNTAFRGAIKLPAASGQNVFFVANSATVGRLCSAADVFDVEDLDSLACDGGALGPDLYMETKKYTAADSLRKKTFKQIAVHYNVQGGNLRVDTVAGMGNVGKTMVTKLLASVPTWNMLRLAIATWSLVPNVYANWSLVVNSQFKPKRVKFQKRSQLLSFRIWQEDANITKARLGPFQIGYKLQRKGRV